MERPFHHAPARAILWLAFGAFLFSAPVIRGGEDVRGLPELSTPATNLLAAVTARYAAITNLTCDVRRQVPGKSEEFVSRVAFARGGRLHVETLAPDRSRAIVDGQAAWTKSEKDKKPRRVAFEDQSPAQKSSVLCVPASPEEILLTLDPASGADRPSAAPHARQVVFRIRNAAPDAPGRAIVSLDEAGRVRGVDLFADTGFRWRVASYAWDVPVEVAPGVWLFGRASAETAVDGHPVTLLTRFDHLRANQELDPDLFNAERAFGADPHAKASRR